MSGYIKTVTALNAEVAAAARRKQKIKKVRELAFASSKKTSSGGGSPIKSKRPGKSRVIHFLLDFAKQPNIAAVNKASGSVGLKFVLEPATDMVDEALVATTQVTDTKSLRAAQDAIAKVPNVRYVDVFDFQNGKFLERDGTWSVLEL